jgi:hypothetical protein
MADEISSSDEESETSSISDLNLDFEFFPLVQTAIMDASFDLLPDEYSYGSSEESSDEDRIDQDIIRLKNFVPDPPVDC